MNEQSTSQILQEARALVAQGWCRGKLHVVSHGRHYYCALGALRTAITGEATGASSHHPIWRLLDEHLEWRFLAIYNDGHTQTEILALFDRALTEVTK